MSHSSLPVALLASHPPCGSLWAAPKAPLGPRFPSGQFAALTRREKALYCPFWRRGSQCRAQWSWIAITQGRSALVLAFFRRQNGRAFFPPLPIAARFPHSWRWADLNGDAWDASVCWGDAAAQKNRLGFDSADGINHTHNGGWNVATGSWIFLKRKKPTFFRKLTGPCCEPKGLSPDGGLYRPASGNPHQTGEPWHPSCHGGKTPAKPNVFLRPCANSTQSGVKGHCP